MRSIKKIRLRKRVESKLTYNSQSFRDLFIIDKERIIQYHTINNLLCGRNINELLYI